MYTPDEIKEVQESLSTLFDRNYVPSPERIAAVQEAARKGIPNSVFLLLAVDNFPLYERVQNDPAVAEFGPTAFLPMTAPLVFDSAKKANLKLTQGTRGRVGLFTHPDGEFVVKPFQSTDEQTIAPRVAELGFGPRQFQSIPNVMTEELIHGTMLTGRVEGDAERMKSIGRQIGEIFNAMQRERIYYNDAIADDFGKSHVFVQANGVVRLIDYGVSLWTHDPVMFTDEQVWNYLRTMPAINCMLDGTEEQRRYLMENCAFMATDATPDDIIRRQREMIETSLSFLTYRIAPSVVRQIAAGLRESGYM